jgi:hypothetical protein
MIATTGPKIDLLLRGGIGIVRQIQHGGFEEEPALHRRAASLELDN